MKYYFLFFIIVAVHLMGHAQSPKTAVLHLKNGNVYRGAIVEQIPDSIYKIKIAGGSVIVVPFSEISFVSYESSSPQSDDIYFGTSSGINRTRPRNLSFGFQIGLSYIMFFDGNKNYLDNAKKNVDYGAGISLMPEIRKGDHFSFLAGLNFQYIKENIFECFSCEEQEIIAKKGYLTRFQIPVWLRWSYGHKLPVFFQVGWGIGGDFHRGWGTEFLGGHCTCNPEQNGWQSVNIVYMNMMAGLGFRKEIKPGIEIVSTIEGTPIDYQFNHKATYSESSLTPYFQYSLGFTFYKKTTSIVK